MTRYHVVMEPKGQRLLLLRETAVLLFGLFGVLLLLCLVDIK